MNQNESPDQGIGSLVDAPKEKKPRQSKAAWIEQRAKLDTTLYALITSAGALVGQKNKVDGAIIIGGARNLVNALLDLADENKDFRIQLLMLTSAGVYGNLAIAVLGIIIPIAMNHNLLPPLFAPKQTEATVEEQSNGYSSNGASAPVYGV